MAEGPRLTPTPTPNDAITTGVPSDRLWLRSELMGTQVITRDTGRRLGVVGEVIVDIDRREVVAVGLRDNPLTRFLPGLPRWMPLDRIRQVGDVILVDSADSLSENFNPERYSRVINCQVITESGEQLGRVLGFAFDIETGELTTLVMGALGVPLLGEGVLSTWEMPVEEIVSSGPDRIIVYEGAEDKLKQLNSGVLEKLGVGGPSWEEQERERYRVNLVPVENQLTSGQPQEQEQRRLQASEAERFEADAELEYVELRTGGRSRCSNAVTSMSPRGTTSSATPNLPATTSGRLSEHRPTTSPHPSISSLPTRNSLLMRSSPPTRNSLRGVPCQPPAARFSSRANPWMWNRWRMQRPSAEARISTIPGDRA